MNKYEWSESGLKMLHDIENSIRNYGGRERLLFALESEKHKGYTCQKENCDFCERFKLVVHEPVESKNPYLIKRISGSQVRIDKRNFVKADNSFNY